MDNLVDQFECSSELFDAFWESEALNNHDAYFHDPASVSLGKRPLDDSDMDLYNNLKFHLDFQAKEKAVSFKRQKVVTIAFNESCSTDAYFDFELAEEVITPPDSVSPMQDSHDQGEQVAINAESTVDNGSYPNSDATSDANVKCDAEINSVTPKKEETVEKFLQRLEGFEFDSVEFLGELNRLDFNTDEFLNKGIPDVAVYYSNLKENTPNYVVPLDTVKEEIRDVVAPNNNIVDDFSSFALENIEVTQGTQLDDSFTESLLAAFEEYMLYSKNIINNDFAAPQVIKVASTPKSTPQFTAPSPKKVRFSSPTESRSSSVIQRPRSLSAGSKSASVSPLKSILSVPKRVSPGPLNLYPSVDQSKPHNYVPSLDSFRVKNNIHIEDVIDACSSDGITDGQFILNKKYDPSNPYFSEILKTGPEGNSGCCPYCHPTQEDIDNGFTNFFKPLNTSHYLHHLVKSHGVLSNGTLIPDPVNLIWAQDGRNEVEAVRCPDCSTLVKLLTFDELEPQRNRLLEYVRHYELAHIKGKGQKRSPKTSP